MDIVEKLRGEKVYKYFPNNIVSMRKANDLELDAANEIEHLRKEREFLKTIISEAIDEIEKPLNEMEIEEILLRMYGAVEEGTGELFG